MTIFRQLILKVLKAKHSTSCIGIKKSLINFDPLSRHTFDSLPFQPHKNLFLSFPLFQILERTSFEVMKADLGKDTKVNTDKTVRRASGTFEF